MSFLELDPSHYARWFKTNIINNEFAEENVDFKPFAINGECGGQATKDFKLTAHFAKKLSQKGNGAKGEEAREYFTTLEEKVKQSVIDLEQLDPQTRLMNLLAQSISRNELEQKRQAEQINRIEQKQTVIEQRQEAITDTFQKADDTESFQKWANSCITKIAKSPKFNKGQNNDNIFRLARNESYEGLK